VTYDELKAEGYVEHHRCGACGSPVGYLVHPQMAAAVFDSGCDCSGGPNYRVLTHQELADITTAWNRRTPEPGKDGNNG